MSTVHLRNGDCVEVMGTLADGSVGAIVSDPPYGLRFMGKEFDDLGDGAAQREWHRGWITEAYRVLKPGGVIKAFCGTRTFHHLAAVMREAGFTGLRLEAWSYGSGFPKSMNIGKQIDKHGGSPPSWFGPWFRTWREENKITQKQVAALFPSKTGNLTGCVANWELGFNIPTPEQFNIIRDTFGLPFASIEAAEREVVGQRTTGIGTGRGAIQIMRDGNRDITAPATLAAKTWEGWGTALKPAWEPVLVGRKTE